MYAIISTGYHCPLSILDIIALVQKNKIGRSLVHINLNSVTQHVFMDKKTNILSRALAKLNLMQKQLVEESQVLDELKEQEEADASELETLKADLAAKAGNVLSLNEELKKYKEENAALSGALMKRAAEFTAELDRERTEFRLNYGKMETAAAEAEKGLLKELETLRDSLRQKAADAARAGAEVQTLQDRKEALAADYEARLLRLEALNSSIKEEIKKQKAENETLIRESSARSAEEAALRESERAGARIALAAAHKEILSLGEAIRHLRHETDNLSLELEKARSEDAEVKALREAGLVKITELEMFSKSAASALKESKAEIEALRNSGKDLSDELYKERADSRRRLEILRLELDDKNRQLARLTRELDAARAEKKTLR